MQFEPLALSGAFRIRMAPHADERGHFARTFCAETFTQSGLKTDFVQRSLSFNRKAGVLRGLHFQAAPKLETKLVRCTRGAAFDVLVDLRPGSATYGRWHAEELTADNGVMVYIPEGFAHGFQALLDETEIAYEITPSYAAELGRGVRWDDPDLAVRWPLAGAIVSERDRSLPLLREVSLSA